MKKNIHQTGMFQNQNGDVGTNVWLTPPEIIESLGKFDLDPASPIDRPWDTAQTHFTIDDNGLLQQWHGRVWLNPPYDSQTIDAWMRKMSDHNNGIALTFARTDRNTFHNFVFPIADSIFYVRQRLHFYNVLGERAKHNAGAPSVLIAYGEQNSDALANVCLKGTHVMLNRVTVLVVSFDRSWRVLVQTVLVRPLSVEEVVKNVELLAPDKIRKNKHYREKIRQQLHLHCVRISKGVYTKAKV